MDALPARTHEPRDRSIEARKTRISTGNRADGGRLASGEVARLAHRAGTCAAATQRAGVPDKVQMHAGVKTCSTGQGDGHNGRR